jgi:HlyD family type I secretion membrane fusion protein
MASISPELLFSIIGSDGSKPEDPRRDIFLGGAVAAAFFVGLVGWAAFARMDAATNATGVVAVSGHRQAVQSRDGGIISALHVKEGQYVHAGDVLIEFAPAEVLAEERALTERVIDLQAELARLDAQQAGQSTMAAPPEFAGLTGEDRAIADRAMAAQQRALLAETGADAARHAVQRQRIAEAGQQELGYERQLAANHRQHELNAEELSGMRELAAKGYAPQTRVRALEGAAASLDGEAGAQTAEVARLKAFAGETRLATLQADEERAQQTAADIRRAQADLQQVAPQLRTAREQLKRTQLAAPVSGAVVGLTANTVGGVAGAGQRLMDIVPDKLPLIIEAQVAPRDANDLKVGQAAQVRLEAASAHNMPVLHGSVSRVSADSVVDEHSGRAYFTADVVVPRAELALLSNADGQDSALRPGMPVDVIVPLRKRTALQFWLEPLSQRFWRSFHEH